MKILIVAATKQEVQPLIGGMTNVRNSGGALSICKYKKLEIDFLITGPGMVATAYYTGKVLSDTYDMALNIGVCGGFNRNLDIGSVVNIVQDHFSELGAQDGEDFLSIEEIGLEGETEILNETEIKNSALEEIPKVCGITVNTVHGNERSIEKAVQRFHPITESMEGAAFMFACEKEGIPYAQIRAVSNYVERRNRDAWNIPLAIANLNKKMLEALNSF